jgi:glutaminyl-peptide cyclotransferase
MALALLAMLLRNFSGVFTGNKPKSTGTTVSKPVFADLPVPDFSADSAMFYLKKQVDFGPRVPNTSAHVKCAKWLAESFRSRGLQVIEQKFTAKHYLGETYNCTNIIAQYRPDIPKRILLAAHWDSRFMADKDDENQKKPIDGADDGASGVAALLEIARNLQAVPPNIGVDLICFDAEDNGYDNPGGVEDPNAPQDTWCLGSQYWAKNQHRPSYSPYYAILLDLIGAKGAQFLKEGVSREIAPVAVNNIWNLAHSLGYSGYFLQQDGPGITDDHVYVYRLGRIPMIDIISMPDPNGKLFGAHHHTHDDNLKVIDPGALKAVGQTTLAVVYRSVTVPQ